MNIFKKLYRWNYGEPVEPTKSTKQVEPKRPYGYGETSETIGYHDYKNDPFYKNHKKAYSRSWQEDEKLKNK